MLADVIWFGWPVANEKVIGQTVDLQWCIFCHPSWICCPSSWPSGGTEALKNSQRAEAHSTRAVKQMVDIPVAEGDFYLWVLVKIGKASHIKWERTMLCSFIQMTLSGTWGLSPAHFLQPLSPPPWLPPILWLLSSIAPAQSCSPFKSILTPNTSLFSQPACPKYFPPALTERVFTGQLQNNKFPFLRRLYGELCGVAAGQRVII